MNNPHPTNPGFRAQNSNIKKPSTQLYLCILQIDCLKNSWNIWGNKCTQAWRFHNIHIQHKDLCVPRCAHALLKMKAENSGFCTKQMGRHAGFSVGRTLSENTFSSCQPLENVQGWRKQWGSSIMGCHGDGKQNSLAASPPCKQKRLLRAHLVGTLNKWMVFTWVAFCPCSNLPCWPSILHWVSQTN